MRRILRFVGLKVAEIGWFIVGPFRVGEFLLSLGDNGGHFPLLLCWIVGAVSITASVMLSLAAVALIPEAIKANWKWAE